MAYTVHRTYVSGLSGHPEAVQASQYQQDPKALEQVFEFIMHSLANYRALYQKVLQLSKDGLALISSDRVCPQPVHLPAAICCGSPRSLRFDDRPVHVDACACITAPTGLHF